MLRLAVGECSDQKNLLFKQILSRIMKLLIKGKGELVVGLTENKATLTSLAGAWAELGNIFF